MESNVDQDAEDNSDDNESFNNHWGWFNALETMAGEDITKIPKIIEYDFLFVMNHLAYMADINEIRKKEHNKMMAKYNRNG